MFFRKRERASAAPPGLDSEAGVLDRLRGGQRTVIGSRTRVRGSLRGEGAVLICGTLKGDILVQGGLTVAPGATVEARVEVERARVAGRIEGEVRARDSVRVDGTGTIDGGLAAPVVDLRYGSTLRGRASIAGSPRRGDARPKT
jgi:cytoskeletal protein CcmA (bactofilin family)